MLRKLVLVGVVAGASASVPILHQNNPEALQGLMRWHGGAAGPQATESVPTLAPTLALARPRQAEPPAETLSGRKVRLVADAHGHFNADFRLNGRAVPAMVDTGASLVAINRSTARRIGIGLNSADFTAAVETANGRARAARVTIDRIAVGRVEFRDVPAMVLEDRALSETLIGMSFLSKLRRFHVEGGALVLEQ